ncbi:hypothetical protein HHI36_012209 [Cryptolaemus montrouzieri]|uniref:Serpin domain-containing protein n=1 Tax=Cryptolaemus montrouzieri TaxID=559131 RepID=A0ABD2NDN0_9CUCU
MKIILILAVITAVLADKVTKEYVHSNNEFAINLLGEVGKDHRKNVVFSALSAETILGLVSLGAKGDTAAELKKVLQLPSADEKIKSEFNNVQTEIEQAKSIEIHSANQVYLADGFQVESEFLKTATEVFRAGVQNVDFNNSADAAAKINAWVEEKTQQKIKNLIKVEQLNQLTRMVLVNALYFSGRWESPFDLHDTKKGDFHVSKDETVQVDVMQVTANLLVHKMNKYNVTFLRLPYSGTNDRAVLTIAVPHDIDALEHTHKHLKSSVLEMKYKREYVKLFLPKFRVETTLDLKEILKNMGITTLFSKPDLSGITKEDVNVAAITQKVFVDVNEHGTEAAAATAAISNTRILSEPKAIAGEYHIDRPFFFSVQYDNVALITGRVINPLLG